MLIDTTHIDKHSHNFRLKHRKKWFLEVICHGYSTQNAESQVNKPKPFDQYSIKITHLITPIRKLLSKSHYSHSPDSSKMLEGVSLVKLVVSQ